MGWINAVFFFLVAIFLLLSGVSSQATGSCNDNLTFFKMAALNNSHVGLWNSSYTNRVCFNDFFNMTGRTEEEIFSTVGGFANLRKNNIYSSNVIMRIHGESNSHAAIANGSGIPAVMDFYNTTVAYGDLACSVKTLANCENVANSVPFNPFGDLKHSGKIIALLNSSFNSHVTAYPAPTNYSDHYKLALCCASRNFQSLPTIAHCGNGYLDAGEECDGNTLSCSNNPNGNTEGSTRCYAPGHALECQIDYTSCRPTGGCIGSGCPATSACLAYSNSQSSGTLTLNISGTLTAPATCNDFNNINEVDPDFPGFSASDHNLTGFKEYMCNMCHAYISQANLGETAPQDAYDLRCSWNGTFCNLQYYSTSNTLCTIAVVPGSDSECAPGQDFKTINVTDSCLEETCSPPWGCQRTVPCPKVVQLPFFDWRNFSLAFALIGAAYLAFYIRKK